MANSEKNTNAKPNILIRLGRWFLRLFKGIGRGFKNMAHELKKVTWPSKRDMLNYSLVVFAFIVIMSVAIGVFDVAAGALIDLICSI